MNGLQWIGFDHAKLGHELQLFSNAAVCSTTPKLLAARTALKVFAAKHGYEWMWGTDKKSVGCLQVSTVLGAAVPESRRQNEWTEGVAIWIAVIVVSCVGEFACLATCLHYCCAAAASCHVSTFAEAALCACSSWQSLPQQSTSPNKCMLCLGAQPSLACPAACAWCNSTLLPVVAATTSMQCGLCHDTGRFYLLQAPPTSAPWR